MRLHDRKSRVLTFGVSDETAFAAGLACGGTIRVLVEPVGDGAEALPEAMLAELAAARAAPRALAVVTTPGHLGPTPGRRPGDDPATDARFRSDRSGMEEDGRFIAVHNPPLRLIVVGAVHIAQPLLQIARTCGYAPTLIDPRDAFGSAARFPGETILDDWPDEALAALHPDARTAIVTLTHDPKLDDPGDPLRAGVPGLLPWLPRLDPDPCQARGPADRRGLHRRTRSRSIHAPVGLDIGAKTPGRNRGQRHGADHRGLAARLMRFGPVPLSEAEGAILAHSVALPGGRLRKGCVLGPAEIAQLRAAAVTEVIVARLDPGDVPEDAAALGIARALVPDPAAAGLDLRPVGTGRVNLHARAAG